MISADVSNPIGGLLHAATGAVSSVTSAVNFGSDPLGWLFEQLRSSAQSLATSILPAMVKVTHPDLGVDWFISAYRVSFAVAVMVFVVLLMFEFVRLGGRRISGDEMAETLALWVPVFFLGAAFGPALGAFLVTFFGSLGDSLVAWGLGTSATDTAGAVTGMLKDGQTLKAMAGGVPVAVVLTFLVVVGLLLALLILLVQVVTLYFSGAVLPLGIVWLIRARSRSFGWKIPAVWLGILASHVLLFFLLGIAMKMTTGLGLSWSDSGLQTLANVLVMVIALFTAALAPLGLLKFAPVSPVGMGPTGSPVTIGGGGSSWDSDASQTSRLGGEQSSTGAAEEAPGDAGTSGPGPIQAEAMRRQAAAASGTGGSALGEAGGESTSDLTPLSPPGSGTSATAVTAPGGGGGAAQTGGEAGAEAGGSAGAEAGGGGVGGLVLAAVAQTAQTTADWGSAQGAKAGDAMDFDVPAGGER